MATPAQTAANQSNAQFSTGPCSAEGKAAVSQNARKHGLSSHYVMLSEAERPLFDALESALRQEINPNGALQESIFRELAAAAWTTPRRRSPRPRRPDGFAAMSSGAAEPQ